LPVVVAVEGVVDVALPPNEIGGLGAFAALTADKVALPPPTFPNIEDFGGPGLGDAAGVVENGLLVPDPLLLLANPLKAVGFAAVLDDAPPAEFVVPNGDVLNLNLGPAAVPEDDSVDAGVVPSVLGALKLNAGGAGFDGSGVVVEPEEAPGAGLDAEFLENPKLNFGTGALVVDPVAGEPFCAVLEVPKAGAGLKGSLAVVDGPKTDVGFPGPLVVTAEPKVDVGLEGSAPGVLVFPNENGEPPGVVLGAVNEREAGCIGTNPPARPNNDAPFPEFCAGFSGSAFF
jgi:hypothetical protein